VLSSGLGIVAQPKESADQQRAGLLAAKQTLAIVTKIDDNLTASRSLRTTLTDAQYSLSLNHRCRDKRDVRRSIEWLQRYTKNPGRQLNAQLLFLRNAKESEEFLKTSDFKIEDLHLIVSATPRDKTLSVGLTSWGRENPILSAIFNSVTGVSQAANGKVTGF
jgi:hypothetical protein